MGVIHCCGGLRRSKTYRVEPEAGYVLCELDVVDSCALCENYVLQLTRIDYKQLVSVVRKSGTKARKLFERLRGSILFEIRVQGAYSTRKKRGFYLNYSEYGVIKRCYSNVSRLQLGKLPVSRSLMSADDFSKRVKA